MMLDHTLHRHNRKDPEQYPVFLLDRGKTDHTADDQNNAKQDNSKLQRQIHIRTIQKEIHFRFFYGSPVSDHRDILTQQ